MIINPYAYATAGGGGGGYGSHRYWRLFITQNAGHSTNTGVAEIEFRGSVGGADLTGSGTAISGGSGSDVAGNSAAEAFDNTSGTNDGWARSSTTNTWIGYDFGTDTAVVEVAISAWASLYTVSPESFTLDWSDDGSSWTTADTFTCYGWVNSQQRVFPETAPAAGFHRFWRVFVTSSVGGTQTMLTEVEMRATASGADQTANVGSNAGNASGRIIGSTITLGGNEGFRAFDNVLTTSTGWFVGSGSNQWVGFVFPNPVAVEEVTILGSSNTARSPSALTIDSSDDVPAAGGGTWNTEATYTSLSWSAGETKTFSVP